MAVTHATTTAEPNDPAYDISNDAWEEAHAVADGSFVAAKLAASATDVLFGRSTAGAGNGQEIAATAAGRALLDDANAAAQLVTLGVGTDAAAGTGSMRTLGTGATQAAAGNHTHELDYVALTSPVSPTATTEGTANTIVTGNAVAFDGSTIAIIEFFSPNCRTDTGAAGRNLLLWLYEDGTSIGLLGIVQTPAAATIAVPVLVSRRMTPANGSRTYSVRASVSAGTGTVGAGAGGAGAYMPAYIRITRA